MALTIAGLYIHIPFCRRLCPYCHFYRQPIQEEAVEEAVAAMTFELDKKAEAAPRVDTVYLGGGSPSLLPSRQLAAVMEAVHRHYSLPAESEITIEANPEDLTKAKLKAFRHLGINRLSIGIQSFQAPDLQRLGRSHRPAAGRRALELAREAGFPRLSIDLIIAIPGQTTRDVEKNLIAAAASGIGHLSLYFLEGVPGKRRKSSSSHDSELYAFCQKLLKEMGFSQYEVSNFSRPGEESRHNLKYWLNRPYLGIGPSAASYLDGCDLRNRADLHSYITRWRQGRLPLQRRIVIPAHLRRLVVGLRLVQGVPRSALAPFPRAARFLLKNGFLERQGSRIAIPADKILLLQEILGYFI